MDKVLFLDFDGVLNNDATLTKVENNVEPYRHCGLESSLVEILNRILDATDAKVVFSTSWRTIYTDTRLVELLERWGFRHGDRVIGRTPKRWSSSREFEIESWLLDHTKPNTRFLVIDDIPTRFVKTGNQILTDSVTGILDEHVEAAVKILNEGPVFVPFAEPDEEKNWRTVDFHDLED